MSADHPAHPVFPGGTAVTHLRPYDWPAEDVSGGSGTPHLHTVATEAYVVLSGHGAVQTLSYSGFEEYPLHPGAKVWFSPGVVHRVLDQGGLEVLVIMSDAGIPEAGDAIMTFPPDVLADPDHYRRAADLPDEPERAVAMAARRRRDLALDGFATLRAAVESSGPAALEPLHRAASRLVAAKVADWCTHAAAETAAEQSRDALTAMLPGPGQPTRAVTHLAAGRVAAQDADAGPRRYGMCGRLQTWRGD